MAGPGQVILRGDFMSYGKRTRPTSSQRAVRKEPEKLDGLIAELMARRGYARQLTASIFQEAWAELLVPMLAQQSKPGKLRAGVLEVTVANSTILQELTFQKQNLIQMLNQKLNDQPVTDIRFRIGSVG